MSWRCSASSGAGVIRPLVAYSLAPSRSVALHLERLQNFHSLFGILAGLKSSVISRLHLEDALADTWRGVYDRLAELSSTRANWQAYRAVKAKATRFPFFPFVGVYLQDLQVAEAKEKTLLEDGVCEGAEGGGPRLPAS